MKKLLLSCVISAAICPTAYAATQFQAQINSETPNFVVIMAEDLSPRIGAFGDEIANTPNIDELAEDSVRFTSAYTMAPVCAPSRASFITGRFQQTQGLQHMRTSQYPQNKYAGVPPAEVKAFPELLRANGYVTFNDVKTDYQFIDNALSSGPFTIWDGHGDYMKPEWHFGMPMWEMFDLKEKPFYVQINPQITHESAIFTIDHANKQLEPLINLWNLVRSKYNYTPTNPDDVKVEPYYPDTPEVRQDIAQHYDNIQVFDQQVGKIVQKLKDDGLWDNTVVIVTTDHGDGIPRHKRDIYDSGLNVPLIVRVPEKYQPEGWQDAGKADKRLISFEDLAPTILGLADIEKPHYMTGIDISKDDVEQRQYVFSANDRMDEVAQRGRTVRDERFRYIRNYSDIEAGFDLAFRDNQLIMQSMKEKRDANELNEDQMKWFEKRPIEELYDLENDPYELHNLADDAKYKKDLLRLRNVLAEWMSETDDMSIIPEETMVNDFENEQHEAKTTLDPMGEFDPLTRHFNIVNRTYHASIGYRLDNGDWEVYNKGFIVPEGTKTIEFKAVRYGWNESNPVSYSLPQ